jgi:hypothetical protein
LRLWCAQHTNDVLGSEAQTRNGNLCQQRAASKPAYGASYSTANSYSKWREEGHELSNLECATNGALRSEVKPAGLFEREPVFGNPAKRGLFVDVNDAKVAALSSQDTNLRKIAFDSDFNAALIPALNEQFGSTKLRVVLAADIRHRINARHGVNDVHAGEQAI